MQYWKALDILAGTAPSVVTERPFHLLLHLACLVEYRTTPVVAGKAALEPLPAGSAAGRVQGGGVHGGHLLGRRLRRRVRALRARPPPRPRRRRRVALDGRVRLPPRVAHLWHAQADGRPQWPRARAARLPPRGRLPRAAHRVDLAHRLPGRAGGTCSSAASSTAPFSRPSATAASRPLAALSAFAVSGLFHEYAFASASRGGAGLGRNLVFFLVQAVFCTAELLLTKAPFAQRLLAGASPFVSDSARVLLTTLLLVPFSPLFMAPLEANNTIDAMLTCIVRVRVAIA